MRHGQCIILDVSYLEPSPMQLRASRESQRAVVQQGPGMRVARLAWQRLLGCRVTCTTVVPWADTAGGVRRPSRGALPHVPGAAPTAPPPTLPAGSAPGGARSSVSVDLEILWPGTVRWRQGSSGEIRQASRADAPDPQSAGRRPPVALPDCSAPAFRPVVNAARPAGRRDTLVPFGNEQGRGAPSNWTGRTARTKRPERQPRRYADRESPPFRAERMSTTTVAPATDACSGAAADPANRDPWPAAVAAADA